MAFHEGVNRVNVLAWLSWLAGQVTVDTRDGRGECGERE